MDSKSLPTPSSKRWSRSCRRLSGSCRGRPTGGSADRAGPPPAAGGGTAAGEVEPIVGCRGNGPGFGSQWSLRQ